MLNNPEVLSIFK